MSLLRIMMAMKSLALHVMKSLALHVQTKCRSKKMNRVFFFATLLSISFAAASIQSLAASDELKVGGRTLEGWVKDLDSENEVVRLRAVKSLGPFGKSAIPALAKASARIRLSAHRFPPTTRAAIVGIATPLLPCGPLYAMLAIALATGSTIRGIETMLVFGLGALPAIWATQVGSTWFQNRVSPKTYLVARRTLAFAAAISLLWHFTLFGLGSNRVESTTCRCELTDE